MYEKLTTLLNLAINNDVTDIHFQLKNGNLFIQFRKNGDIYQYNNDLLDNKFFNYIQYQANLDVSNLTAPQSGSFEIEINDYLYAIRISIVHSLNISNCVLRILNKQLNLKINQLTYCKDDVIQLEKMILHKNGLILICGLTGSGKTTTLYTLLNHISYKKIFTLEDPVELYNENFVQLQINEKQNLTYESGIKQLLRHDPDVIVIGEIRDSIAAKMALTSALTGHLVISTIHSSNCYIAIKRMLDLGVNLSNLKDVLIGVSYQTIKDVDSHKKIGEYEILNGVLLNEYLNGIKNV